MTLDKQRWRQIETLYHAALERAPDERAAYLADACADDSGLLREVEELLRHDGAEGSFMQDNALAVAAQALDPNELSQTAPQLFPGQGIGAYKILALLGRGGMGVVYRARDERLRREVAIKVLPASFAHDADRLRRFEQEAHATSALNHPNILTIYDIGAAAPELGGAPFIVTELLEGEELRAQLESGALPARSALEYALQITQGLAAAHEKGIVHRDLKPENLFVTKDGRVKILDFGLAKLRPPQPGVGDTDATTQKRLTHPGVVMGTAGYMSPEQVRGQETDHRSDIFAFGLILYEMLSGQRAFRGASAIEVMNAILKEEPAELGETNPKIRPQIEKLVRRCLEKKPERRFQTASDLGFALESLSTPSGARPDSPLDTATASSLMSESRRNLRWLGQARQAWIMALALLVGMLGFAWAYFTRRPVVNDVREMKYFILPPDRSSFVGAAVSPDGRHLAFTAATGGKVQLWVQALNSTEARALPGTQGAREPFWSPDSRFIGFFADSRLKKIEVTSGLVQPLFATRIPLGGAWNRSGMILFGQSESGLLLISETGGEVTQVTTPDNSRQEIAHGSPTFLPDGRHFLYTIMSGQKETRGVYLGSLDGRLKRRLLDDFTPVKYIAAVPGDTAGGAGWALFGRDGALLVRPFDPSRLDFSGEPFSLSVKLVRDPYGFILPFSLSDNGVVVFDSSFEQRLRFQYRWVDRRGQTINTLDVPTGFFHHCLSPDEKRFIAERYDPRTSTYDLWLCDVSGGNPVRFTFDPAIDYSPVWAPNGSIVWASTRDGAINLYQKAASGAGEDMLLLKSEHPKFPTDWSRNGQYIFYQQLDPKTTSDMWVLPMTGSDKGKPFRVLGTEATETAGTLSPNGRWLAYTSDVSGIFEVYVQSFPGGSGKRQVSNGGGVGPRWRNDGTELFYYAGDGKLMAASVRSGESLETSGPVPLFEFRAAGIGFASYAVTADGQRFLIKEVVDTEPKAPLTVVVNWAAGVKK